MGKKKDQGLSKKAVRYWKGIEHAEGSDVVKPWLEDEFPHRRSIPDIDRRSVLKLMGGAMALAGLGAAGCRYAPEKKIVPYVRQKNGAAAGQKKQFATCATFGGYAVGVLVEQVDGRPIRIDGHPEHPASMGSLNAQVQAEILNLYDPDRAKMVEFNGDPANWSEAITSIQEAMKKSGDGSGVAFLSETVNSPSLASAINLMMEKYPGVKWYQYEPANRDNVREGAKLAFGNDVNSFYDFTDAQVILSLDSNCLAEGPASIAYGAQIAANRVPDHDGQMSRIYSFESHPSTLGMLADHRLRLKPSEMLGLAKAIASRVGAGGSATVPAGVDQKVFDAVVSDLVENSNRSAVICGDHLSPEVHAAVHAINQALGNFGNTVFKEAVVQPMPVNQANSLATLVEELKANRVQALVTVGGNPAYTAPADYGFGELIKQVPLSAHLGTHLDETSHASHWRMPMSHFLESWGDGFAYDGTYTIGQPLIQPLYDSQSATGFVDLLIGGAGESKSYVKEAASLYSQGQTWDELLANGFGSATPLMSAVVPDVTTGLMSALGDSPAGGGLELLILPDPNIGDGRYANNNWLQELPKPISNITWDNALYMSDATAKKLGVGQDNKRGPVDYYGGWDMVTLKVGDRSLEVPVYVNLGQADDVLVLHMGYGREKGGEFLKPIHDVVVFSKPNGGGFNANEVRTSANPTWVGNVEVTKSKGTYELANTQFHNTIDASVVDAERELIHEFTLAGLVGGGHSEDESHGDDHGGGHHERDYGEHGKGDDFSFYSGKDFQDEYSENYQWAMTIDLATCTGCNACVTACQAENNIPTVGKEQVKKGREMHWMRIDRYYKGGYEHGKSTEKTVLDRDNPPIYVQPVTCMHCEQAPCEPVCPVAATTHSAEGINQMVYNRCVGTRYCSNNCPYKVRRYNFFHYSQRADQIPVLQMLQNPEVTVRFRGVMEKCTYCVQRINDARIESKKDNRKLKDGDIKTACQVACPTHSIVFGDIKDANSKVSMNRKDKRSYLMLEELNTRPRTSYLAKVRNPHPELEA